MIAGRPYRVGVVGASSLLGKELTDALTESPLAACDVVLLDTEEAAGRVTAAGDEAAFIQKLDSDSFAGVDFVFFAGDVEMTRRFWKTARQEGASIIDMTYALEAEPDVIVRGLLGAGLTDHRNAGRVSEPDLTTPAVVAAHPAAQMLLLTSSRVHARFPVKAVSATVFEPASEHGQAAMDELHQQTVSLLSFQTLPRLEYDAQVAFNLLPSLGDAAKVKLAEAKERIARHYQIVSPGVAPELNLQLIQAPVFHGYTASVMVELQSVATVAELETAMQGEHVDIVGAESDPPSNLSVAGQSDVLVQVSAVVEAASSSRFWVWMAADNLKLAALNAIECANELRRLRPQGTVQ